MKLSLYKHPQRHIRRQPSPAQTKRRNAFRACVNFWHRDVGLAHALEWQQYADRHPITNRRGRIIYLTSWSAFLHINLYRAYTGVSLITTPPTD